MLTTPFIARFIQEDTYRGDGLNLYAYCHNHPIDYYGPSGYDTKQVFNTGINISTPKPQPCAYANTQNTSTLREVNTGDQFYKQGGGSDLDDFMTPHAEKHVFNPNTVSSRNKTQFGENIDVAKLREDTMLHPDKIVYDSEHNVIKYQKEYDFNISTPDTPTGSHRVFISLDSKPGKTNRNSQFPYYGGKK